MAWRTFKWRVRGLERVINSLDDLCRQAPSVAIEQLDGTWIVGKRANLTIAEVTRLSEIYSPLIIVRRNGTIIDD